MSADENNKLNAKRNAAIEKCGLCGQPVSVDDDDVVQVHGGENGLCHASCLKEYDDANETGENEKSA